MDVPGVGLDDIYNQPVGYFANGTPTAKSGQQPWTPRNIGAGYDYRPWMTKICQWPGPQGWQTYVMRVDNGPEDPVAAADLCHVYALAGGVPSLQQRPTRQRHALVHASYLDGSIRGTGSRLDNASYSILPQVNCPP